jgi:streptomycin 6-kinase
VVEQALRYADRRAAAFDAERCVVAHGDPHPGNTLRVTAPRDGAGSGFVLVDPDGFRCDPAYDLGVAVRDWVARVAGPGGRGVLEGYCALLAARTGVVAREIWEWGYLERVSTGLYVLGFGGDRIGRAFLGSAARLLD